MSKRPHPDDDNESPKRLKSDSGAPVASSASLSIAEKLEQARAKAAAIRQAMQPSVASVVQATRLPSSLPARPGASSSAADGDDIKADMLRRVAEATARAQAGRKSKLEQGNPYMTSASTGKKKNEAGPQGTGLRMAAHPLILDSTPVSSQTGKERYKPMQPKFATTKANARLTTTNPASKSFSPLSLASMDTKINPYAVAAASNSESGFDGAPREKVGRSLRFNQKGKYVQIADQMRKDAKLEELRKRIAERAGKAGLDSEFDVLEKNIRREPPPDAEWWDEVFLPNKTYEDLDAGLQNLKIRSEDSPITDLVQHPIPILAPWDKNAVPLKPLKLTKRETKRIRKNRRKAEQQDKQDRIKVGLLPPDPPKVRLANLMKVLTSDAVQDPTKVEARVRREVAQRKIAHDKMNKERKLTDVERREKIENKKMEEEKKGIFGAVFKIKTLKDPSHRFKVRRNAEQMGLTGVTIFNPNFSLVVIEGSAKAVRQYDKLMTSRISWTQPAAARSNLDSYGDADEHEENVNGNMQVDPTAPDPEEIINLDDNRCDKIWEGPLRDHAFKVFKAKPCPTDTIAKEALGTKWSGHWDLAKNFVPEDELE